MLGRKYVALYYTYERAVPANRVDVLEKSQGEIGMNSFKASKSVRLFLFVVGSVIWGGIALTGFQQVHWLLYVPAVFLIFAALTGFCPGLIISRWILREPSGE